MGDSSAAFWHVRRTDDKGIVNMEEAEFTINVGMKFNNKSIEPTIVPDEFTIHVMQNNVALKPGDELAIFEKAHVVIQGDKRAPEGVEFSKTEADDEPPAKKGRGRGRARGSRGR